MFRNRKFLAAALVLCASPLMSGEHFRIKAKLWSGAPQCVNYRRNDVIARGAYMTVLEKENEVYQQEFLRRSEQRAPLDVEKPAKHCLFCKFFRSATRDGATTVDPRLLDVAPVRLEDIRLAAYSCGQVAFTGRIKGAIPAATAAPAVGGTASVPATPDRTDGCYVTFKVRGFSSSSTEYAAHEPNGPVLFECSQTCWVSKEDDRVISLVCPANTRLSPQQYTELTHLQVEMETRRNR